jgi:hypothetical protein
MATFDRGNEGIHNWLYAVVKVIELLVYVSLCYVLISSETSHFVLENLLSLDAGGWAALRTGSLHDLHSEFPIVISFGLKRLGSKICIATWSANSKDIALRDVTPRR